MGAQPPCKLPKVEAAKGVSLRGERCLPVRGGDLVPTSGFPGLRGRAFVCPGCARTENDQNHPPPPRGNPSSPGNSRGGGGPGPSLRKLRPVLSASRANRGVLVRRLT